MTTASTLSQRIKAEFDERTKRRQAAEHERALHVQEREQRISTFNHVCDELKSVWQPRFEEFAKQFGDKIKVTPTIEPSHREAKVAFLTDLANMTLTLTASVSPDENKFALDYDLLIIPMFLEYDRHARLEMPLDKIDKVAIGRWVDDQLISCVRTYLAMQDNELYIKRALVEDPVTGARFLKDDAAAKFEYKGRVLFFASDQTLRQYKEKLQITT